MSRWVRCSYGKRAGFVDAKIGIISENSKFFETFLPISAPKVVSQALWKAIYRHNEPLIGIPPSELFDTSNTVYAPQLRKSSEDKCRRRNKNRL